MNAHDRKTFRKIMAVVTITICFFILYLTEGPGLAAVLVVASLFAAFMARSGG